MNQSEPIEVRQCPAGKGPGARRPIVQCPTEFSLYIFLYSNLASCGDVLRSFSRCSGRVVFAPTSADLKYSDEATGCQCSGVSHYPERARAAIREMHRQVGPDPVYGPDGVIRRGLIIRHLVLPNDLAGSEESLRWVRDELGTGVTLSIMSQYYPVHRAGENLLLSRPCGRESMAGSWAWSSAWDLRTAGRRSLRAATTTARISPIGTGLLPRRSHVERRIPTGSGSSESLKFQLRTQFR